MLFLDVNVICFHSACSFIIVLPVEPTGKTIVRLSVCEFFPLYLSVNVLPVTSFMSVFHVSSSVILFWVCFCF